MKVVQKEVRNILMDISKKTGYPIDLVENVYMHEFEFIFRQITKGERNNVDTFENILVKRLGTFIANRKHILKLKSIEDAKKGEAAKDSV